MLIEKDLFGTVNKVENAIEILQQFQPPEGYFLAFSGGKDSIVIKELCNMAGVKYHAEYSVTTIDPPELTKFIKIHHPDVKRKIPEKSFFELLVKKGYPTRQFRWCCELLKENAGNGRLVITGVRKAESARRSKRRMVEICYRDTRKRYLHPILEWSDKDVWEFIRLRKLPYCSLYDEGWSRVGCLFCPMNTKRIEHLHKYPAVAAAVARAFNKRYKYCQERNLTSAKRFKSGEEMFHHWIYERQKDEDSEMPLFLEA